MPSYPKGNDSMGSVRQLTSLPWRCQPEIIVCSKRVMSLVRLYGSGNQVTEAIVIKKTL